MRIHYLFAALLIPAIAHAETISIIDCTKSVRAAAEVKPGETATVVMALDEGEFASGGASLKKASDTTILSTLKGGKAIFEQVPSGEWDACGIEGIDRSSVSIITKESGEAGYLTTAGAAVGITGGLIAVGLSSSSGDSGSGSENSAGTGGGSTTGGGPGFQSGGTAGSSGSSSQAGGKKDCDKVGASAADCRETESPPALSPFE